MLSWPYLATLPCRGRYITYCVRIYFLGSFSTSLVLDFLFSLLFELVLLLLLLGFCIRWVPWVAYGVVVFFR